MKIAQTGDEEEYWRESSLRNEDVSSFSFQPELHESRTKGFSDNEAKEAKRGKEKLYNI